MAVDNPGVIDAVEVELDSGIVALTIADHLEWDDANEHLLILQEKLNRYIGFIESGELLDEYPKAIGRPVRIDVVFRYEPTEVALEFLNRTRKVIEGAGCSFAWNVLESTQ